MDAAIADSLVDGITDVMDKFYKGMFMKEEEKASIIINIAKRNNRNIITILTCPSCRRYHRICIHVARVVFICIFLFIKRDPT